MKKCQPRSLTPFLDGEMTEDAWHETDEHLQSCPACSAQLDELTAAWQQVRAMGRAQIPDDSLKTALEVIAVRAGLTAEAAMIETSEIARAQPIPAPDIAVEAGPQIIQEHWPADADRPDQAWTPGELPGEPSAEVEALQEELPEIGLVQNALWPQPPAPTWVEPERRPSMGPAETAAPAVVPQPTPAEALPIEPAEPAEPHPAEAASEQAAPSEGTEPDRAADVLETHPSPPPAQLVPSWMEVPLESDAELEEVGRAAVDDAIGSPAGEGEVDPDGTEPAIAEPVVQEPGPTTRPEAERLMWITPRTPVVGPVIEPEAETPAVEPAAEPLAAHEAPDDEIPGLRGYREALLWARAEPAGPPTTLLTRLLAPEMRIKVGLGAAAVTIVLVAGILYSARNPHPSTTAVSQPATGRAASPTPPAPSARPTTAASAGSGAVPGSLSELVTAGTGGTGWTVSRIRLGSPGNGITRVVLDLNGTGSTPTAQLGRGSDGSIYLGVPGLTISPSVLSGLAPSGALKAITEVSGPGTSLRFTTNGSPGFSIGYLTGPDRLVLDFK